MMGADLVISVIELPDLGMEFNTEEWYLLLSAYINSQSKDKLETIIEENAPWVDGEDLYEVLRRSLELVILNESRDTGFYLINGRWVLMTGGMTWGDSPTESYDDVALISDLVYYDRL